MNDKNQITLCCVSDKNPFKYKPLWICHPWIYVLRAFDSFYKLSWLWFIIMLLICDNLYLFKANACELVTKMFIYLDCTWPCVLSRFPQKFAHSKRHYISEYVAKSLKLCRLSDYLEKLSQHWSNASRSTTNE